MTPPWLDPRLWLALAVLLIFGGVVVSYEIRLAAVRTELESAKAESVAHREAEAALKVQLGELGVNRDKLAAVVADQNQRIEALRSAATAEETAANLRALRVLEKGKAASVALDAGAGPAEFNDWLQGEFAP